MRPFVHFVPCTVDNFADRLEWCRAHPKACARIARASTAFATALSYENEVEAFARSLAVRLGLREKQMFGREIKARRMLAEMLAEIGANN